MTDLHAPASADHPKTDWSSALKDAPYRAILHCSRCHSPYAVPQMAERFLWWFCHRREDGVWCGTGNVWGKEKAHG